MEFREVTPDFATQLGEFLQRLSRRGDDVFFHPHPLTAAAAHQICSTQSKDFYCIALWNNSVLSYGMLRGWSEGFEVPSLGIAVDPDSRGLGLGSAMMAYLHVTAQLRGARTVRLTLNPENPALHMYRKFGYEFTDLSPTKWVGVCHLGNRS